MIDGYTAIANCASLLMEENRVTEPSWKPTWEHSYSLLVACIIFPSSTSFVESEGMEVETEQEECCMFGAFAVCVIKGRINSSKRERYLHCSPEFKTRLALMSLFLLLPRAAVVKTLIFGQKGNATIQILLVLVFPLSSVGLSWCHSLYSGKQ